MPVVKNGKRKKPSRITLRQTENILLAAGHLFWRKGYTATSIEDIAQAADVNKASIYYYFRNKSQMLFNIAMRAMTDLLDMARPIADADLPAKKKLEMLIAGHIGWQAANPGLAGIGQMEGRNLTPKDRRVFIDSRDRYEGIFLKVISDIMAEHGGSADPKLTTLFSLGTLNSIIAWYKPSGRKSPQQIAASVHSYILAGLVGPNFQGEGAQQPHPSWMVVSAAK